MKTITAWVAKNKGEYDVENISFFETKRRAKDVYGDSQEIVRVSIKFEE